MLNVIFIACAFVTGEPVCQTVTQSRVMTPAMCESMKIEIVRNWLKLPSHPFTKYHGKAVFCERGAVEV